MTLARLAYERFNRRNDDALPWDQLTAAVRHQWEQTVALVLAEAAKHTTASQETAS